MRHLTSTLRIGVWWVNDASNKTLKREKLFTLSEPSDTFSDDSMDSLLNQCELTRLAAKEPSRTDYAKGCVACGF
jgi:hypothetical protein